MSYQSIVAQMIEPVKLFGLSVLEIICSNNLKVLKNEWHYITYLDHLDLESYFKKDKKQSIMEYMTQIVHKYYKHDCEHPLDASIIYDF